MNLVFNILVRNGHVTDWPINYIKTLSDGDYELIIRKPRKDKGFTYCLALFLAHQHMMVDIPNNDANLWFNAASDHLYDLQIPDNFIQKDSCEAWRDLVLDYGHGKDYLCMNNLTEKDIHWALEKCKSYLLAWDKQCGISIEKGQYE